MLSTLKATLLSFAGIFGYSAEVKLEKDIETSIAQPTEANIEAVILDAKAVVEHLDKNIPVAVVDACANVGISIVSFAFNPTVKGGATVAGEVLTQLPIINPKWSKVTPEHAQALVQALSDIAGDYGL